MPFSFRLISTPRIHDITTDPVNPPELRAAARERRHWHNPVQYEGKRIATLQQTGYPDIQPLQVQLSLEQAYVRARAVVEQFGWQILDEDPDTGTIEAVAITRLFRFRDDVVIRISRQPEGSRVDIRSASRLGISDLGANARRIRTFMEHFVRNFRRTAGSTVCGNLT